MALNAPFLFEDSDLSGLPIANPGSGLPWNNNGFLSVGDSEFPVIDSAAVIAALGYTPADDADVVHKTGAENISGVKTFFSEPVVPSLAFGAGLKFDINNAAIEAISTNGLQLSTLGVSDLNGGAYLRNNLDVGVSIYQHDGVTLGSITAGAAAFAGIVNTTGHGTHTFNSNGGIGENVLAVGNLSAGVANYAGFRVRNDNNGNLGTLLGMSSTYSSVAPYFASGVTLISTGSGGLNIASQHASGDIRLYTGGNNLRLTIAASGAFTFAGAAVFNSTAAFNGAFTFAAGVLHGSTDGYTRFYFDAGAASYWYSAIGATTALAHLWRGGGGNLMTLDGVGNLALSGGLTMANDVWMKSGADLFERIKFVSAGPTYFKAFNNYIYFAGTDNVERFWFHLSTGNATFLGNLTLNEVTAPAAPAANKGVLYLDDNGAGKTRLMIRFATGAAQQIAIEP